MLKTIAIIFALFLFFIGSTCQAESNTDLLDKMQQQLDVMQKRLTELESKNAVLEARLAEKDIQPGNPDKNGDARSETVRQVENAASYVLGNLSLSGNIAGVVQGTFGNDDNTAGEGDVSDGSWSSELWIKSATGAHGKAAMLVEAGQGKGVTDEAQTFHGVNDDARGENTRFEVTNAFYEHLFLSDRLIIGVGKMDIKDYFDTNAVAHDRHTQFLSSGFHHSIGVAWPEGNGLTIRSKYSPTDLIDVSLCWTEAKADWEDVFEDSFFIGELGVKPALFGTLTGNYRFYGWMNGKDRPNLEQASVIENDGYGLGLSADQQLHPSVTMFARLAWEEDDAYEVEWAWSAGFNFGMNTIGRPDDVFAIAFGQALTSDALNADDETQTELYYRLKINEHLSISPHFQYCWKPKGDATRDDFAVIGVRSVVSF
jgi:carbohydrate-selective porin (OprB family)